VERKLSAILAADVVAYTRLMGADEAGTLRRLSELRKDFLEPLIAEHGGRIVKLMGDGLLVEFPSIVNCVACATAWQEGVAAREATGEGDKRLQFRIGINLGDVIVDGDDLHGDGVNIAARLEGLAPPGGVCLSGDAYRQVNGKLGVSFTDMGEQRLKNVAQAVRVFRVASEAPVSAASTARPNLSIPDKPSIAVLPFTNMSGDPEQEYFSDGISEDIITGLSRIGWLFVIARNSSFVFKGKAVDIRQIASELGVRYVLEGSVRKAMNKVRVTAQLIDAQSTGHLWSERYDRSLDDIFLVQDEIVGSIVHALGAADGILEKSERRRIAGLTAGNPTAYDYYLQAREQFDRQDDRNFDAAETLFRKSISIDPGFAPGYSALAWLFFLRFKLVRTRSFADVQGEVSNLALEALRLDENEYRAHTVLGFLYSQQGRYSQSVTHFDRALSINPNDANVMVWSAEVLVYRGRAADARVRCEHAIRLNPKCPDFYFWLLGFAQFHLGQYGEAADTLERMTAPRYARRLLAATYAYLGRTDDARAEAQKYLEIDPEFSISAWAASENYADPSERERYADGLRKSGLPE